MSSPQNRDESTTIPDYFPKPSAPIVQIGRPPNDRATTNPVPNSSTDVNPALAPQENPNADASLMPNADANAAPITSNLSPHVAEPSLTTDHSTSSHNDNWFPAATVPQNSDFSSAPSPHNTSFNEFNPHYYSNMAPTPTYHQHSADVNMQPPQNNSNLRTPYPTHSSSYGNFFPESNAYYSDFPAPYAPNPSDNVAQSNMHQPPATEPCSNNNRAPTPIPHNTHSGQSNSNMAPIPNLRAQDLQSHDFSSPPTLSEIVKVAHFIALNKNGTTLNEMTLKVTKSLLNQMPSNVSSILNQKMGSTMTGNQNASGSEGLSNNGQKETTDTFDCQMIGVKSGQTTVSREQNTLPENVREEITNPSNCQVVGVKVGETTASKERSKKPIFKVPRSAFTCDQCQKVFLDKKRYRKHWNKYKRSGSLDLHNVPHLITTSPLE